MPSPVGHLLAGAAIAWGVAPRASHRLAMTAAILAAAPDLDLLLPVQHRTVSHSIGAVAVVTIVAMGVTGKVKTAAVCGLAWASHLLMDWLGPDPVFPHGLQILWPFSDRFFISGLDWFMPTARTGLFTAPTMMRNLEAIAYETAILGPIALTLYLDPFSLFRKRFGREDQKNGQERV